MSISLTFHLDVRSVAPGAGDSWNRFSQDFPYTVSLEVVQDNLKQTIISLIKKLLVGQRKSLTNTTLKKAINVMVFIWILLTVNLNIYICGISSSRAVSFQKEQKS